MKIVYKIKNKIKNFIKKNLFYLIPTLIYEKISQIPVEKLKKIGIDTVLIDLDNTLVPWNEEEIPDEIISYLFKLKQEGFKLCIVSNALPLRVKKITQEVEIPYIALAAKPSTKPLIKAIKMLGSEVEKTVIIGDQLFTDILAGNRLGIKTILVKPLAKFELITSKLLRIIEKKILNYTLEKDYTNNNKRKTSKDNKNLIYE